MAFCRGAEHGRLLQISVYPGLQWRWPLRGLAPAPHTSCAVPVPVPVPVPPARMAAVGTDCSAGLAASLPPAPVTGWARWSQPGALPAPGAPRRLPGDVEGQHTLSAAPGKVREAVPARPGALICKEY